MAMTNTEKRDEERKFLRDVHPKVRQQVIQDKQSSFYNDEGRDLSDHYELTVKTTDEQVRAMKGNDLMEQHAIENGKFIITFFESARLVRSRFPSLSAQDVTRLMYIGTYVAWETNRLQSDNGKKVYKKKDTEELVGMSKKRFNELYKRFISEGILIEGDEGELFINPTVIYRGKVKKLGGLVHNLSHTRVFRKTVRELYEQFNGRRLGQLSLVYSVVPFLNFDYNMVCYNPEETDADMVKPISVKVLADILEYKDASKLKSALKGIEINGQRMFNFVEDIHDGREKNIYVNPRVVFAGNGEALESIKTLFN